MTKTEIAVLVISSGLAAGLVQSIVTLLSGRWDRKHRSRERREVEKHEATLRRDAAHDAARAVFLPKAESVAVWVDRTFAEIYWQENGDFRDPGTKKALPKDEAEVLDLLRDIKYGHPSRKVRERAESFFNTLSGAWGEIVGDRIPDPDLDEVRGWNRSAQELVELIHSREVTA